MQVYKLTFKHWKTGDLIEKRVVGVGFPVQGTRNVFYSLDDDTYIDVIRDTIVSLENTEDVLD